MTREIIRITSGGEALPVDAANLDAESLEAELRRAHRSGAYLLCLLNNPDEQEVWELGSRFGLHPLATADAATGRQQPKVQNYPQHLFIAMWTLATEGDLRLGQVFLFVRKGLLVCVQWADPPVRLDLRSVVTNQQLDVGNGSMSGAYRVMSRVVADYAKVESAIEQELERVEGEVFDVQVREDSAKIYRLRLRIGKVGRAVATFAAAIRAGREHLDSLVVDSQQLGPYLLDLYDDVAATATLAADQNRALDGIASTHENNMGMRQNDDMRKISAIAALLGIPTVLAGIFGMNFDGLPLTHWAGGWMVICGVMAAIDLVVFVAFKRRKWL